MSLSNSTNIVRTVSVPSIAEAAPSGPRFRLWSGRTLSLLPTLLLIVDRGMKLVRPAPATQASVELGIPLVAILALGAVLLVCVLLYLVAQTALVGVLLLASQNRGSTRTQSRGRKDTLPVSIPMAIGTLLRESLRSQGEQIRRLLPESLATMNAGNTRPNR
jgi:hypothetical protein